MNTFWSLVIIAVALISLNWLVNRPPSEESIRRECYEYAYGTPNNGDTNEWVQATKYYYEACLHRHGLKE